jgi:hypothetical protein
LTGHDAFIICRYPVDTTVITSGAAALEHSERGRNVGARPEAVMNSRHFHAGDV